MAKVKKPARLTGAGNKRKPGAKKAASRKPVAKAATTKKLAPAKKVKARKKAVVKTKAPPAKAAPVVNVAIRELDPQQKCGPGTSVQFLYRVDELVEGKRTPHLVFYDHHGWYCEHGRTCPAVGHAKKHNGQIARAS